MRLAGLEIRRAVKAGQVETRDPPAQYQERGASGTVNTDGWLVPHEYKAELRFPDSIRVFDRMRRSDHDVREALFHIWAPIKNATWAVEPASDEPEDLEVAAFVRNAYFDWLSHPFSQYLHQALTHLATGFQLFETPLQVVEGELEYDLPDGERVTVTRQWLSWRRFAQRMPDTIRRWFVEDGELTAVEQWAWKDETFDQIRIPADQFVLYVNEQEGDDFTGVSVLRTAYKAWFLKEAVERVSGVAAERHGVGINVAYVPERYRDDKAMLDTIEKMVRDVRASEFAYLVFPGPKGGADANQRDGFFFEIASPQGQLPDLVKFLEYLRGGIKGNVLARFAELGHGSVGARATGESQSPVWIDALHAVAKYISDVNQVAIRRLVDLNYPDVSSYPKLVAHDIESKDLEEFARSNALLVSAGAIVPDESYRGFVREGMGAPDEDKPEETADPETPPEDEDGPEHQPPDPPGPGHEPEPEMEE